VKTPGTQLRFVGHDTARGVTADHYTVKTASTPTTTSPVYLSKYDLEGLDR
jgi:hypothetical protein